MDYRKLISFGKGGYVISIPKEWVVENKLEKGSFITVKSEDGSLLLTPKDELGITPSKNSEIFIDLENKSLEKIKRELISAYLKSYNQITLRGENLKSILPEIKSIVRDLIALEIVESSREKLVLHDFLDFNTLNLQQIFRKMDNILRSMFSDLLTGNHEEIILRGKDIDRHFILALKAIKKATYDTSILKRLETTLPEIFVYWNNALAIEAMAEDLVRLSRLLQEKSIMTSTVKEIFSLISQINETFAKTMVAFYKSDSELAFQHSGKRDEISQACEKLYQKHWKEKDAALILELIRSLVRMNHKILRRVYG